MWKVFISKLSQAVVSPDDDLLCCCRGSLIQWKRLLQLSLLTPFIPCRDLYTHQFPLSFSNTHSATHSQHDGCLFNPKPLMESAYCLYSTYSRWVNISQLRPLFSFHRGPQPENLLAGLAKSSSRAWYSLCLCDYTFPLASLALPGFLLWSRAVAQSTWMVLPHAVLLYISGMIGS